MHISKAKRSNPNKKVNKGILVGYSLAYKGYSVYDLMKNQVVICQYLVVDEDATCDWIKEEVQQDIYVQ